MQNKAAIWLFTILLAIACLYQLSFSWVVGTVETDAKISAETKHLDVKDSLMNLSPAQYSYKIGKKEILFGDETGVDSIGLAELKDHFEQEYLINIADKGVYPLLGEYGHSYQYCKNHQLNLGLDLQGGMSVTLEVSMLDLVETLAGRQAQSQSVFMDPYNAAKAEYEETNGNFIDIFKQKWDEIDANQKMTRFFSVGSKDLFDDDLSNDGVVKVLKEQAARALEKTEEVIMARINKFGVSQPNVSTDFINGLIHLELPGVKDVERARKLIISTANLEFWETSEPNAIYETSLNAVKKYLYNQEKQAKGEEVLELDSLMVFDTVYAPLFDLVTGDTIKDSNKVVVLDLANPILDSVKRPYTKAEINDILTEKLADDNQWDRLIKPSPFGLRSGIIGDVLISDTAEVNTFKDDPSVLSLMPANTEFLWGYKGVQKKGADFRTIELYSIQKNFDRNPRLDGDDMASADYSVDMESSGWQINMIMTSHGADVWEEWTEKRIGKPIAIIMDDAVYSAPNITVKISGGSSRISGRFTQDDVKDVVTVLEGGSLKIKPRIIDEAKVGPTLGQANIDSGFLSFTIAIILVLLYMIFYYAKA
ncbi:MAG: SecD/SecF fusion protein, partial [Parvicellaceae bacterium]